MASRYRSKDRMEAALVCMKYRWRAAFRLVVGQVLGGLGVVVEQVLGVEHDGLEVNGTHHGGLEDVGTSHGDFEDDGTDHVGLGHISTDHDGLVDGT